ncbi:MAG: alpha-amylase, partial [Muribaculaceae bacterium]|nr:alpha-amylase [Muribaculaceae bacterium]
IPNRILVVSLLSILPLSSFAETQKSLKDKVILHAWSWSFRTIADNMKDIADAGYDYVQTSPANACYIGENGGKALYSSPGDTISGKWYYYYQPTDWTIGNYLLGNREEFKAMCDSAYKYNVKVLVDVLPNHTAIDHTAVLSSLDAAVDGHENLYHANGFTDIKNYNDREQCTTGKMGGLPDVNTENPDFQYYYMQYINDLVNLGARGFRYDTAKHIGLPSDPLDPKATRNNFWDIATGREAVKGLSLLMPDSLFLYGEVLQGRNVKEKEYAEYMGLTASSYGHALRKVLNSHDFNASDLLSWHHPADPDQLVTWVESHDTYCNEHESAGMEDNIIRMGWVFLTAREAGTPLFFSRPDGSTRDNYWGNNRVGYKGNDEFIHEEVVAVNKFRKEMAGYPEIVSSAANGSVIIIERGSKGIALINISPEKKEIKIPVRWKDGNYTDKVYGVNANVNNGIMVVTIPSFTSYLYY